MYCMCKTTTQILPLLRPSSSLNPSSPPDLGLWLIGREYYNAIYHHGSSCDVVHVQSNDCLADYMHSSVASKIVSTLLLIL